ncbi:MAG: HAD domain-containing protein [Bacteroidales bacterium]|jgi:FMN phosphatase YigB (HAD superfamily)
MKLILLDIDGVLNHHDAYKAGFCKYTNLDDGSHYQTFDPTSKALLNKLIEEFDAKIVISSTWRCWTFFKRSLRSIF